jgi:hypothetical protein
MSGVAAQRTKVGELRPSQVLFAFGVGSVVDLPNMSVMVLGLDDWDTSQALPLGEERLLAAVREELGPQVAHLYQPPLPQESDMGSGFNNPFDLSAKVGIPVAPFPGWVLCPRCRLLAPLSTGLFGLKTNPYRPDQNRYVHTFCNSPKPPPVLPARFLVACKNGHLDDFPWLHFVHQGKQGCPGQLKIIEYGVSGAAADIELKCERCNASRRMSDAFGEKRKHSMPRCRGRNPHLRNFSDKECAEQMQSILLGASNSWFPIMLSALSIPTKSGKLGQIIERYWPALQSITSEEMLRGALPMLRAMGQAAELAPYSQEEIWSNIQQKHGATPQEGEASKDLKAPEYRVFTAANEAENTPDFRLAAVHAPKGYEALISKVVLVERLREVRALVGFTRIESPNDFEESHEIIDEHWARLSRHTPKWAPASEVRGEGIFIEFSEQAIGEWRQGNRALDEYERKTFEAHKAWRHARGITPTEAHFPGIRYVLLHSFSHALMRQLAIECGYTAASIRERIYSRPPEAEDGPMAGVLLYTAAPDSEGTLGGLVSLGRPVELGRHIDQALELMGLCASDPLCAEHDPFHATTSLHWASCHACLFSPETSCERGNKYLDRALITQTVKVSGFTFFK